MSQSTPISAITPTDEATYNYLTKLSNFLCGSNRHEVLVGRHEPLSTIEPSRCAILGINDDNELAYETMPPEGSTRQEVMMKTIEMLETQAQTIMARVEGKNPGWVLAKEKARREEEEVTRNGGD